MVGRNGDYAHVLDPKVSMLCMYIHVYGLTRFGVLGQMQEINRLRSVVSDIESKLREVR